MRLYRRRIYVTKKDFQSRFIVRFVVVAIMVGATGTAVFNALAWKKLERMLYTLHLSAVSTGDLLVPELRATALVMATLIGLLSWIAVRRLIGSISGPLFRMKKDVRRMAGGDLSFEVILRTGDRFQEVADAVNATAGALERKWQDAVLGIEAVTAALHRLERFQDDRDKAAAAARDLADEGKKLRKSLEGFKTAT